MTHRQQQELHWMQLSELRSILNQHPYRGLTVDPIYIIWQREIRDDLKEKEEELEKLRLSYTDVYRGS